MDQPGARRLLHGVEDGITAFAVESRRCEEPHDGEVFAVLRLPGRTYPTGDVEGDAQERCLPEFSPYVGLPYEESVLGLIGVAPTPSTWAFGDRQIICMLGPVDGEPVSSSMRGTAV